MKTNKMLSDSSISKVWENFRKMKGVVVSLPVADWVATEDGTFTNTVYYDGFTSDEILEIDLYNDGNLTETHISEYDGYITEFDILDGELVATATTQPTVDIDIICRGEIVGEKVVANGGGSSGGSIKIRKMTQAEYNKLPLSEQKSGHYIITDAPGLTAKTLEYDDSETGLGVNNVQDAIVEQNKNIPKIKTGISMFGKSIAKGAEEKFTINFDEPFETIPVVVCTTMNDAFIVQLHEESVTTTEFSIYAYNVKMDTTFNGIHWIAVGT